MNEGGLIVIPAMALAFMALCLGISYRTLMSGHRIADIGTRWIRISTRLACWMPLFIIAIAITGMIRNGAIGSLLALSICTGFWIGCVWDGIAKGAMSIRLAAAIAIGDILVLTILFTILEKFHLLNELKFIPIIVGQITVLILLTSLINFSGIFRAQFTDREWKKAWNIYDRFAVYGTPTEVRFRFFARFTAMEFRPTGVKIGPNLVCETRTTGLVIYNLPVSEGGTRGVRFYSLPLSKTRSSECVLIPYSLIELIKVDKMLLYREYEFGIVDTDLTFYSRFLNPMDRWIIDSHQRTEQNKRSGS